MYWYLKVLKQYADFSGRARRKEFWMFNLFNAIFLFVAVVLDNLLGITFDESGFGPLYLVYVLGVLIPSWAVAIRRLHDIEKSGWWCLLNLVPILSIWFLVLMATDGSIEDDPYGNNEYGRNPKEEKAKED